MNLRGLFNNLSSSICAKLGNVLPQDQACLAIKTIESCFDEYIINRTQINTQYLHVNRLRANTSKQLSEVIKLDIDVLTNNERCLDIEHVGEYLDIIHKKYSLDAESAKSFHNQKLCMGLTSKWLRCSKCATKESDYCKLHRMKRIGEVKTSEDGVVKIPDRPMKPIKSRRKKDIIDPIFTVKKPNGFCANQHCNETISSISGICDKCKLNIKSGINPINTQTSDLKFRIIPFVAKKVSEPQSVRKLLESNLLTGNESNMRVKKCGKFGCNFNATDYGLCDFHNQSE